MDLDTFLTTLYVVIDDWYKREMSVRMKRHAGPALQMSDSELLTIAIAGQWRVGVPWQSERGIVRSPLQYPPLFAQRLLFIGASLHDIFSLLYCCWYYFCASVE